MKSLVRGSLLLALTLMLGAWAPIDPSRPVWSGTVPFAMTSPGSADLPTATSEAEVQRAMLDWTLVSCTSLRATWNGTTTTRPVTTDGNSVIGWLESGWPYDSSAIGVTIPQFYGGVIYRADMEMNGVNFTWTTASGRGGNVNIYSIVLHEGGHYYGLDHSDDPNAAMYAYYTGGIDALGDDDRNGICALYPGTGSDCTTTGCPTGQMCTAGACVTPVGGGNTCERCVAAGDCTRGLCLGYPDGFGYCGTNCNTDSDCGPSESCSRVGGTSVRQCVRASCAGVPAGCTSDAGCSASQMCNVATGACVPRVTSGTGALGTPCADSAECMSGLCFAGTCGQTCDGLNPASCPSGFYCNGQVGTSCGEGLCQAGGAGGGVLGDACTNNTDCSTLYCAGGHCSTPCIVGGAVGCADGFACQVGPGCGSCQAEVGAVGDPCSMNEDCVSSLCAIDGAGNTFCTALCSLDDPESCAPGFDCSLEGGLAVCVPGAGGLGAACTTNEECVSSICATEGSGTYCTRLCDEANTCPSGFNCVSAGDDTQICRPRNVGGCGCTAAGVGSTSGAAASLGLLGLMLVLLRRRASR